MSVATFEFPSPVGGVPFPSDFAPSVIFALMYGSLIPLLAYRILDGKSRNVMLIGTAAFTVERWVFQLLRGYRQLYQTLQSCHLLIESCAIPQRE